MRFTTAGLLALTLLISHAALARPVDPNIVSHITYSISPILTYLNYIV
ncbi:hypothetical protein EST38_g13955 [Candolleomyces aberdarensis]|uniref:Uncharacterized protein n=1 Tax=Candolleomyces aberdarensis TaxID=2316362 RepID=A0A4Q2CZI3_9AGAR|nr:hypothetical protein EST38_g13955 [Candolleomyces aberdarensis]